MKPYSELISKLIDNIYKLDFKVMTIFLMIFITDIAIVILFVLIEQLYSIL